MEEEQNQEEQKKIGLPEGIFVTLVVLTMDGVEFLIDLTGVGIIIGEIINFVGGGAVEIYLFLKGARGARQLVTMGIGTVVDGATSSALPIKTITWLITWYLFNHPKILEKAAGVAAIAGAAGALKGKYQPSKEEMGKAEGMMTDEQKQMSATREKEMTATKPKT